jgi:outer membrane murein-binding lipoprotein Lpp
MARKTTERYVRYYTFGSTAAKLDRRERKAALPEYKTPEKRKPIAVDPIALVGSAVAVLLAVLMLVGFAQVAHTSAQVKKLQTQVITLELEQEQLRQKYENGYDLEEVRAAAESMGMIPAEEAIHVRVELPGQTVQIEHLCWWDSVMLSLRRFFA